jgi:hypothetical protein
MLGRETGAQPADASRADYGDAEIFALNGRLLEKGVILAGTRRVP